MTPDDGGDLKKLHDRLDRAEGSIDRLWGLLTATYVLGAAFAAFHYSYALTNNAEDAVVVTAVALGAVLYAFLTAARKL